MDFRRYHDEQATPEEARRLARLLRSGDAAARTQLILLGAGVVHHESMFRRYRRLGAWMPMEDAVQEGWLAMVQAADGYDPELPAAFHTFAFHCLYNRMGKLLQRLGRRKRRQRVADLGVDEDGYGWLDRIADEAEHPWHGVEVAEDARTLLGRAGDRERTILQLHYGLDGRDEHSFSEIGGLFGVTKERVRQLEKQAFGRMRA